MRPSNFALVLGLITGWAWGCSVYDKSLLLDDGDGGGSNGDGGADGSGGSTDGGGGTGAMDGGGTGGSGGSAGCQRNAVPPKDPTAPSSDDDNVTMNLVFSNINLGDRRTAGSTAYRDLGFDLDGECTTEGVTVDGGLKFPSNNCELPVFANGQQDGPGGIDNAVGPIIQRVRDLVSGFSSENYTSDIQNGSTNFFVQVSKWNGTPNDSKVTLAIYVAAPFDSHVPGRKPKWDGTDDWPIASDSLENCANPGDECDFDKPKFKDEFAYVVNNKFVGQLADSEMRLDVGLSPTQRVRLKLRLTQAAVVCDIVVNDAGFHTAKNCTLVGRWNADHLLKQLSQFPDPLKSDPPGPLCADSSSYCTFKRTICEQIDIYDQVSIGTTQCNSLSFAVRFDMAPALPGDVFFLDPVANRCVKAVEPSEDSCRNLENFLGEPVRCSPLGAGGGSGSGGASGAGGSGGSGGNGGSGGTDAGSDSGQTDASLD